MARADLVLALSPTQSRFVRSDANICQLVGPMGEGKTHAGVAKIIRHAQRCRALTGLAKLDGALIRDTHENIKTSTVKSIYEVLGDRVVFKNDFKKMYIRVNPPIEMDLFGIDDPASVSKLQGPPYGLVWCEEPAPVHAKANAGLPLEVFLMALARCGRQAGSIPLTFLTHNPADDRHWTTDLIDDPEEYMVADDGTIITKATFRIPKGENIHLSPVQRAMNQAAFKNDPGKWDRYVEGKTANVLEGKRVTPAYNETLHLSQKILPIYPQLDAFRGWDGFQHPCCGIAQYNPTGQFVIHDVLYDEGVGVEELIEEKLLPLLATPKYKGKIQGWRDIGDPSMATADQSSNKRTASKVIQKMLLTRFEKGYARWPNRIDPTTAALKKLIGDGRPLIVISASAKLLHRALRGGWHWKVDNSGHVLGTTPVKNEYSHPGDMFTYLISSVMPGLAKQETRLRDRTAEIARIASYATGGLHAGGELKRAMQWR